jgi:hypothetical protein
MHVTSLSLVQHGISIVIIREGPLQAKFEPRFGQNQNLPRSKSLALFSFYFVTDDFHMRRNQCIDPDIKKKSNCEQITSSLGIGNGL